jgi:hypothetical protein
MVNLLVDKVAPAVLDNWTLRAALFLVELGLAWPRPRARVFLPLPCRHRLGCHA